MEKIDHYKAGPQTEIRFRAGQNVLSKDAKNALDEMASPLKDQTVTSSKSKVSPQAAVKPALPHRGRWQIRSHVT